MPEFIPPTKNDASIFADMRGHHVAVRTPNLAEAKAFYVDKLDFRVVAEWAFADEQLAYLTPAADDHLYVEVLGGRDPEPQEARPYTDLGDSLKYRGYHHFCLNVDSVDETVETAQPRRDDRHRALRAARDQPEARILRRPVRQPDRARRGSAVSALFIIGAGPGTGEAAAERFGLEGWKVVVSSRSPKTSAPKASLRA